MADHIENWRDTMDTLEKIETLRILLGGLTPEWVEGIDALRYDDMATGDRQHLSGQLRGIAEKGPAYPEQVNLALEHAADALDEADADWLELESERRRLAEEITKLHARARLEELHTDAAMCIWEAACSTSSPGGKDTLLEWLMHDEGAAQGREHAKALAPLVHAADEYARDHLGFDDSFDWEFVPRAMGVLMRADLGLALADASLMWYDTVRILADRTVGLYRADMVRDS